MKTFLKTWNSCLQYSTTFWSEVVQSNAKTMKKLAASSPNGNGNGNGNGSMPSEYAKRQADWDFEPVFQHPGAISVGDVVRFSKTIEEEDVEMFARVSGDTNPLHLDREFADDTRFGQRIVHGTLVMGILSGALARLPGNIIYLSQNTEFIKPVFIGDTVTAEIEVLEEREDRRFRLSTRIVKNDKETVVEGEVTVLIDELAPSQSNRKRHWLDT